MLIKVIIGALAVLLILVAVACAGPTSAPVTAAPAPKSPATQAPSSAQTPTAPALAAKPSGKIKGTWIEPKVNGDTISILQSDVEKNWNIHFKATIQGSTENFMAYLLDGQIYVRANVCPPCQSIGYSLDKDVLVCDRCGTRFKAKSGDGIDGACVNYPKASVSYQTAGGNLVMKNSDLFTAYQNTLKQGLP